MEAILKTKVTSNVDGKRKFAWIGRKGQFLTGGEPITLDGAYPTAILKDGDKRLFESELLEDLFSVVLITNFEVSKPEAAPRVEATSAAAKKSVPATPVVAYGKAAPELPPTNNDALGERFYKTVEHGDDVLRKTQSTVAFGVDPNDLPEQPKTRPMLGGESPVLTPADSKAASEKTPEVTPGPVAATPSDKDTFTKNNVAKNLQEVADADAILSQGEAPEEAPTSDKVIADTGSVVVVAPEDTKEDTNPVVHVPGDEAPLKPVKKAGAARQRRGPGTSTTRKAKGSTKTK